MADTAADVRTASGVTRSADLNVENPLDRSTKRAITAQVALRMIEEKRGVHLELVDPGHPPIREKGLARAIGPTVVLLPFLILVAALIAGAFDPRMLDEYDLRDLGISLLGRASLGRASLGRASLGRASLGRASRGV